jgi:hypothetical protein
MDTTAKDNSKETDLVLTTIDLVSKPEDMRETFKNNTQQ